MRIEEYDVKNQKEKRARPMEGSNKAISEDSCSSPRKGKCNLDPNAPEFIPASILYSQRIWSSHDNIYGTQMAVSSQMQYGQQKPLIWHYGGVHHLSLEAFSMTRSNSAELYMFDENAAELCEGSGTPRTTLMIRNIPNKYSRPELIKLLDEHCLEQNTVKYVLNEAESAYDFVYLPIDFKSRCNLGYGFVNFTSVKGAVRFYKARHFKMWEHFNSSKICEISYARLQGKAALEEHFLSSTFPSNMECYLPVKFSPPRNGIQCTPPTIAANYLSRERISSNAVMNHCECNSKSCENDYNNISTQDNSDVPTSESYEACMM